MDWLKSIALIFIIHALLLLGTFLYFKYGSKDFCKMELDNGESFRLAKDLTLLSFLSVMIFNIISGHITRGKFLLILLGYYIALFLGFMIYLKQSELCGEWDKSAELSLILSGVSLLTFGMYKISHHIWIGSGLTLEEKHKKDIDELKAKQDLEKQEASGKKEKAEAKLEKGKQITEEAQKELDLT